MLHASKLVKTYPNGQNKLYALNQVSFEIADGKYLPTCLIAEKTELYYGDGDA